MCRNAGMMMAPENSLIPTRNFHTKFLLISHSLIESQDVDELMSLLFRALNLTMLSSSFLRLEPVYVYFRCVPTPHEGLELGDWLR